MKPLLYFVASIYVAAFCAVVLAQEFDAGNPYEDDLVSDAGTELDFDGSVGEPTAEELGLALEKLALSKNAEAKRMLQRKDYPAALGLYREAHELDPDNAEITNNLGYIYYLLGNMDEAERLYRETLTVDPDRFITYLNLADLLAEETASPDSHSEASRLLIRAREIKGNKPKLILRQARVAVLVGDFMEAERFYGEYLDLRKPTQRLCLEIGDFFRDLGRTEDAVGWYRKIENEELGRQAAGRIWEIEVEKQARKFNWTRQTGAIPAKARMLAGRGRAHLARKEYENAEQILTEALTLAPGLASARADLGDLFFKTNRIKEAELEYLRALAIDHGNAEINARLGDLYLAVNEPSPRYSESAMFFSRALDLRPDWIELHLKVAIALRGDGDLVGALKHVSRYLASHDLVSGSGDLSGAIALKRTLESLLPPEALLEAGVIEDALNPVEGMSEELINALSVARVHLSKGELDAAMAVLRQLDESERGVRVLNLEAGILLGSGRLEEASESLRASLNIDEKQEVIHGQLGSILVELGDERAGRIHLRRADELGNYEATFHLAKLDAGSRKASLSSWIEDFTKIGSLLDARNRLERFLLQGSVSVYRPEAESLLQEVKKRLSAVVIAAMIIFFISMLIVILIYKRVWGGIDLGTLVEKCPETGPQVQRVLSAIRHEVLKHNTMMLGGLVSAVESGEAASDKASHFKKSLLGEGDQGGVAHRLENYVSDLFKIGDANRRRLNLRRKDPAISPLLKGIKLLEKATPYLDRYEKLSAGQRASLHNLLKEASHLFNTEAYEAVRTLLDRLRILEIDKALLRSVYKRCTSEPSFAGVRFKELQLDVNLDGRSGVPLPRQAFEDILANLVRNAIQSSLTYGEEENVAIGLAVESEIDNITGLERLVFMVRDRSHKVITAEMLRGRYIEHGLGMTADLVSRYDGTLDVLPGDGHWSKSVLVKLPRVEMGGSQREATR